MLTHSEDCVSGSLQITVAMRAHAVHRIGTKRMGAVSPDLSKRSWGQAEICARPDGSRRRRRLASGGLDLSPDRAPGSGGVQEVSPTCGFMCI